jgi:ADP-ribose pyrophosphatase YjhB (NUDIX family)
MNSYIKKIRSKLSSEKFIHPGARIIIENQNQEILVIQRNDNGQMGLPAGSLEENETIEECIKREVKEETGIIIKELVVIGVSSHPMLESVEYPNGDKIQYFTIEFYSHVRDGKINIQDTKEVRRAAFMQIGEITNLAGNEYSALESLYYFRKYGKLMLK